MSRELVIHEDLFSTLLFYNETPVHLTWRAFQKHLWALTSLRALKFHLWIKSTSRNIWARYFVWNFKGDLWNSTQNILPIHWKILFLFKVGIWRALKFNCIWYAPLIWVWSLISASDCYSYRWNTCHTILRSYVSKWTIQVPPLYIYGTQILLSLFSQMSYYLTVLGHQ